MSASLWSVLDRRHGESNVLEHPFHERWLAGRLAPDELATYASEYDHVVVAVASAARRAAALSTGLDAYAAEREAHVSAWRAFAKATGWGPGTAWYYSEDPLPETVACAGALAGGPDRDLAGHLVTLQAFEAMEAVVSRARLEALVRHYGFEPGPATEYFEIHATLEAERTARMRAALEGLLPVCDSESMLVHLDAVQTSYRRMLDGLERLAAPA